MEPEYLQKKILIYQQELQKAVAEYERYGNTVRHLEGAILACNEMIKELKADNDKHNKADKK